MSTNGALTTLLNAPGAAGTTFEVAANTGAWFVAGPAIVYRAGTTVFSKTNLEAVTLSAPVGDAITVTRAQQGHAALTLAAGDFLVQGITALDWDTLKALVESQGSTLAGVTVTGTPAAGKAVVAVSASAAQWTDVATQAELDAFTVSGSGTYAPVGRKAIAVYDDFSRYADGALSGQVPIVGSAWVTSGASPTVVTSGKATSAGTGYAYQTLSAPAVGVTCEVIWSGVAGSVMTMACTDSNSSLNNLAPHFNFGNGGFNATIRKDGGGFDSLLSGTWVRPMNVDGVTKYRVSMFVVNGTFVVLGPNGELFAINDSRLTSLGSYVFWEPNTSGSAVASLASVGAYTQAATGALSPLDYLEPFAQGFTVGQNGQVLGNRDGAYQVQIGYEPTSGMPGIILGPNVIRTRLAAAANIGDVTLSLENMVRAGTAVLESGTNTETVTLSGSPSGSGPYTMTTTALTKAHAAGSMVVLTVTAGNRTTIFYNMTNGFLQLPGNTYTNGNHYLGSNLDVAISRSSSNVVQIGSSALGCARTGRAVTGSRPSAATVGNGAMFYDTTLSKPIWSDGTVWRDAAGTAV